MIHLCLELSQKHPWRGIQSNKLSKRTFPALSAQPPVPCAGAEAGLREEGVDPTDSVDEKCRECRGVAANISIHACVRVAELLVLCVGLRASR